MAWKGIVHWVETSSKVPSFMLVHIAPIVPSSRHKMVSNTPFKNSTPAWGVGKCWHSLFGCVAMVTFHVVVYTLFGIIFKWCTWRSISTVDLLRLLYFWGYTGHLYEKSWHARTLSLSSMSAPCFTNSSTTSLCPLHAALCRADSFFCVSTQISIVANRMYNTILHTPHWFDCLLLHFFPEEVWQYLLSLPWRPLSVESDDSVVVLRNHC